MLTVAGGGTEWPDAGFTTASQAFAVEQELTDTAATTTKRSVGSGHQYGRRKDARGHGPVWPGTQMTIDGDVPNPSTRG